MPSSNKTPNLLLNRWLGGDKPKKDDFNEDNEILDRQMGLLGGRITQVEAQAQELLEGAVGDWSGQLEEVRGEWKETLAETHEAFEGQLFNLQGALGVHLSAGSLHVTQNQKDAWDRGAPLVDTYEGDGFYNRTITLGFRPRAGFVFAVGRPLIRAVWLDQNCQVWSAMFAGAGSSEGAAVTDGGFSVVNNIEDAYGFSYRLNAAEVTYVYVVWR